MRFRTLLFLALVAVIAGVSVAVWRGAGPLADPEECHAEVNGRSVDLDPEQGRYAALTAAISVKRGMPARAATIAIATAIQESKLRNIDYGHSDSLGLFQQRPSIGGKNPYWGTAAQVTNPAYAINRFYEELEKFDYEGLAVTVAAQKVQRSAYPGAYADHEADARVLASALTGYSPGGAFSCVVHGGEKRGSAADVIASLTTAFGDLDAERAERQDVRIRLSDDAAGERTGWATAQYLVAWAGELKIRSVAFDGRIWQVGRDSEDGWVPDPSAKADRVEVSLD